jgi:hypothetical protein
MDIVKTLIRIISISDRGLTVIVPWWDHRVKIRIPMKEIPMDIRPIMREIMDRDGVLRCFADVNVKEAIRVKLTFDNWVIPIKLGK